MEDGNHRELLARGGLYAHLSAKQHAGALSEDGSPAEVGPADRLVAQSARSRLVLGDETARNALVGLLLSEDEFARKLAIEALTAHYGEDYGHEPEAEPAARRAAAAKWTRWTRAASWCG